jgi:putative nucleotidyltransferase with HDIG domain
VATPAPSPISSAPAAAPAPLAESVSASASAEAKIKAQSITGEFPRGDAGPSVASVPRGITLGGDQAIAIEHDPYADLDFGDFSELGSLPDIPIPIPTPPVPPVQESPWIGPDTTSVAPPAPPEPTITAVKTAAVKEAAPAPSVEVVESFAPESAVTPAAPVVLTPAPTPSPVSEALDLSALDAIPAPKAAAPSSSSSALDLSALDAIPTPKAAAPSSSSAALDLSALDAIPTPKAPPTEAGGWGNLDDIPAPDGVPAAAVAHTPRGGGLGGSLMGKARGSASSSGPLKSRLGRSAPPPEPVTEAVSPPASFVEASSKPDEPFDAEAAQKKLDALVSNQGDGTSDYIFATPGLDMRMLGRIDGWVSQIEAKDKYKGGHAKAVAEYAQAIAKEMGLPQADIDIIRQASLVHDLGKLGTAAPILQKADNELTDAEFLMIMNHTIDGAELLDSFPDLKPLAPIVRAHHEEYDGNGYPLGLKGEQIPLAARVIGLANYYHERIADKANGKAGDNPGKVQMEIVEAAGKQFDPNACQGLIQAIITGRVSDKL